MSSYVELNFIESCGFIIFQIFFLIKNFRDQFGAIKLDFGYTVLLGS